MKTIVFAVAGYNLAETGRHIEIARICKDHFNVVFISYGGKFESLIEEEGFTLKEMEPRVENEIKYFKEINPACVLTGWCQSVMISARVARVPFVNVLHSTSITEYYQAGLQTWPDRSNFPFFRWFFSEEQLNRWVSNLILKMKLPAKAFNNLAKKYGLREFNNFIEVLGGDYTLLADIPEWVGFAEISVGSRCCPRDK